MFSEAAVKNFFSGEMKSIQKPLEYEPPSEEFRMRLEEKISQYIGNKIEEHRFKAQKPITTNWNKELSREIKHQLLLSFENFKYVMRPAYGQGTENHLKKKEADRQLQNIKDTITRKISGKEIYGFPLNVPFISIDQVWDEVKTTEIHNILHEDIQYVLSVAIVPYPNYVMSVWVYVAVLYDNN